jgi:hypothetical protein
MIADSAKMSSFVGSQEYREILGKKEICRMDKKSVQDG